MRKKRSKEEKMRVSFDLDEVLFVYPKTHKTEPEVMRSGFIHHLLEVRDILKVCFATMGLSLMV